MDDVEKGTILIKQKTEMGFISGAGLYDKGANEEDKDLLRQDAASVNSIYMKIKSEKSVRKERVDFEVTPGSKYKISDSVLEIGNNIVEIKKVLRSILDTGISISEF